MSLVD